MILKEQYVCFICVLQIIDAAQLALTKSPISEEKASQVCKMMRVLTLSAIRLSASCCLC